MTDMPKHTLPPWAAKLTPRDNGTGAVPLAPYAGTAKAMRTDPSVRETEIGPVPSVTPAEERDRHGMAQLKNRGQMSGKP